MVNTWYIHSKSIYLAYTRNMTIQKEYNSIYMAYTKSNLKLYLVYTWYMTIYKNIPGIYLVYSNSKEYTWNIPKIYMAYSNSKVYTCDIPRIYRYYTRHMTICHIWLDYTVKNIYGFVLYQSRTLIAKGYTWYIPGISLGYWIIPWKTFMGLFRTSHVP